MGRQHRTSVVNLRYGLVPRDAPAVVVAIFGPGDHSDPESRFNMTPADAIKLARRLIAAATRADTYEDAP